jgi:hypothetical protein
MRHDRRRRGHRVGRRCAHRRIRIIDPRARRYESGEARRRSICGWFTGRLRIAIRPEIPGATIASISIVAIALVAVLVRAIGSRASVLKSVALTILPGRKASSIVSLALGIVSRSVGERLRGVRRGARLRLKSLLRLRINGLPLCGRSKTIRQCVKIAVILHVVLILARRALLTALCERLRSLRSGNKSEVMFGVLQVILRRHRITAGVSVPCKLEVFFRDVMRITAYFHVWSVRFVGSCQRIWSSPIICRPTAHPLILTWSHFDFPISIRLTHSFRSFSVQAFSIFGMRETIHAFASFEWG